MAVDIDFPISDACVWMMKTMTVTASKRASKIRLITIINNVGGTRPESNQVKKKRKVKISINRFFLWFKLLIIIIILSKKNKKKTYANFVFDAFSKRKCCSSTSCAKNSARQLACSNCNSKRSHLPII